MSKPFALAPCGHVLCHGCLVNWFSNEPAAPLGQAVQQAEPPSAQVEGDEGENNNADDPPLAPAPALPPAERRPAPLIRRKKTCPHCRAVVREKPVEVWSVKDMVNAVVRSGLADPDSVPEYLQGDTANDATTNPWKDIFPDDTRRPFADVLNESMGLRDDEDGGIYRCVDCHHEIWDGLCSSCGRFYPGHRIEFDSDSQDDEDGLQPMWLDYSDEDEEADMDFLRHIIGRRLDDLLDDEALSEGSDHREDGRGRGSRGGSHSNESIGHGSAHSDASNDEEYEGSFIDDSDDVAIAISAVRDIGRLYRAGDDEPVEVYSDEDGRPPPARRGRRVIDSDEEISLSGGDEEDDDLAAAVAARER
ncbi:uncharacterized protein PHACADRAFT_253965 [Phanerochaete carnosa HHB-10118-sp]|uniref:RING-type domain-containing protein n=1 Tax=Phanerochaete carnosa (strain HHB-10118-sp) TaxID=650164 RepID=K5WCG2_PHACS|nr:uncharacterized protein PHACADRAFT_253965 [Phanerochaete carnosa HHB-10118-sp]EKM56694.1 hypothetical protein PHACADRAFT_253965 [Phanerochaete carnosa HHB-10118-sp]